MAARLRVRYSLRMRLWIALSLCALGCAGTPAGVADEFPSAPLETVPSDQGRYHLEVRTSPTQPPTHGDLDAEVRVVDAQGQPVDGLEIEATPWMPSHGHGATKPETVAKGGGRYVLSRLQLVMPGTWELRTTLTGPLQDAATIQLQVR